MRSTRASLFEICALAARGSDHSAAAPPQAQIARDSPTNAADAIAAVDRRPKRVKNGSVIGGSLARPGVVAVLTRVVRCATVTNFAPSIRSTLHSRPCTSSQRRQPHREARSGARLCRMVTRSPHACRWPSNRSATSCRRLIPRVNHSVLRRMQHRVQRHARAARRVPLMAPPRCASRGRLDLRHLFDVGEWFAVATAVCRRTRQARVDACGVWQPRRVVCCRVGASRHMRHALGRWRNPHARECDRRRGRLGGLRCDACRASTRRRAVAGRWSDGAKPTGRRRFSARLIAGLDALVGDSERRDAAAC